MRWAGDDPMREGLRDTPGRVVKAFGEWFAGYNDNPRKLLERTFDEVGGYDEMVVLKDIRFESHCEHHMAPIIGRVHIGYLPRQRVVGISKLARLVELYSRRLQIQERLTAEISGALNDILKPRGVAVVIEGMHSCMSTRGVRNRDSVLRTSKMLGCFRDDPVIRREFANSLSTRTGLLQRT